jgi:hypothetical protein
MAFDWKQKIEDGKKLVASSKKIVTEGFNAAVEKTAELSERAGQKADELDQKYGPKIEEGIATLEVKGKELAAKVNDKVAELRKPKDAPKQG